MKVALRVMVSETQAQKDSADGVADTDNSYHARRHCNADVRQFLEHRRFLRNDRNSRGGSEKGSSKVPTIAMFPALQAGCNRSLSAEGSPLWRGTHRAAILLVGSS